MDELLLAACYYSLSAEHDLNTFFGLKIALKGEETGRCKGNIKILPSILTLITKSWKHNHKIENHLSHR